MVFLRVIFLTLLHLYFLCFSFALATSPLTILDVSSIQKSKSPNQKYSAVVFGATGAVGSELVRELLQSPLCTKVTTITRRTIPIDSFFLNHVDQASLEKLSQHVVDIEKMDHHISNIVHGHDVAFITFGVGQPSKVTPQELYHIDVEITSKFANICKEVGTIKQISLLSSVGVDSNLRRFEEGPPPIGFWTKSFAGSPYYFQIKSQIQDFLVQAGFNRVSIFQPSLLYTDAPRYGIFDALNHLIFPKLHWILPTEYHEVKVKDLARVMRIDAERNLGASGYFILQKQQFDEFLKVDQDSQSQTCS